MTVDEKEALDKEIIALRIKLFGELGAGIKNHPLNRDRNQKLLDLSYATNGIVAHGDDLLSKVKKSVDIINNIDPELFSETFFDYLLKEAEKNAALIQHELEQAKKFHQYAKRKK